MKPLLIWLFPSLLVVVLAEPAQPRPSGLQRQQQLIEVRTLLEQREDHRALALAGELNGAMPDDVEAWKLLVDAHLALGNYAEAEKAAQWMLDLRGGRTDAEGHWRVARVREVFGDLDGAVESVRQSLQRLGPLETARRRQLLVYGAELHLHQGQAENSAELLRQVLDEDPVYEPALLLRYDMHAAAQQWREAAAALARIPANARSPRSWYRLALALQEAGDAAEAATAFRQFLQMARARVDEPLNANRELVLYYTGAGADANEALRLATLEAARRADILTLDSLAVAQSAAGRPCEALETLRKATASGTRHREVLAHAQSIRARCATAQPATPVSASEPR